MVAASLCTTPRSPGRFAACHTRKGLRGQGSLIRPLRSIIFRRRSMFPRRYVHKARSLVEGSPRCCGYFSPLWLLDRRSGPLARTRPALAGCRVSPMTAGVACCRSQQLNLPIDDGCQAAIEERIAVYRPGPNASATHCLHLSRAPRRSTQPTPRYHWQRTLSAQHFSKTGTRGDRQTTRAR